MPTRLDTNFARPTEPEELESLVRDICAYEWGDPHTEKFGRNGQNQKGVDVYGKPVGNGDKYRAAQCKLRTKADRLSEAEIRKEVSEARKFAHPLDILILATDLARDNETQILVDHISDEETFTGGFRVVIWFWDNITERLATYPRLIVQYYRDYYANLTTLPTIERLIDTPLQIVFASNFVTQSIQTIRQQLCLRGIQVISSQTYRAVNHLSNSGDVLPDGIVCEFVSSEAVVDSKLRKFIQELLTLEDRTESSCPLFAVLPEHTLDRFYELLASSDINTSRITVLTDSMPLLETADQIFTTIFDYGYKRRGALATIEVSVRGTAAKPDSALLDLNWHEYMHPGLLPTTDEWRTFFAPALRIVSHKLIKLGVKTRIQINSTLLLPAAIALGYSLNLRVARIGVWARASGASDFKQQFWLSDSHSDSLSCDEQWITPPNGKGNVGIVEVSTSAIHASISTYITNLGIQSDAWLRILVDSTQKNMTESTAIGCANQVGQALRKLNAVGISDIHLFFRGPSALAILIGQRLQACGRIHLYWFSNPTYQFAFTLQ